MCVFRRNMSLRPPTPTSPDRHYSTSTPRSPSIDRRPFTESSCSVKLVTEWKPLYIPRTPPLEDKHCAGDIAQHSRIIPIWSTRHHHRTPPGPRICEDLDRLFFFLHFVPVSARECKRRSTVGRLSCVVCLSVFLPAFSSFF